jgi:hypothetical protein
MTSRKLATKMVALKRQKGVSYLMLANRARVVRKFVVNAIEESRRASRARPARRR